MPRMGHARSGTKAGAHRERKIRRLGDFRESEGVELRHDLAQEPRGIAIAAASAARPFTIAAMQLGISFAALAPGAIARARIVG